jgi:hypothetical protein
MIMKVYNILKELNVPVKWNIRPPTFPSITYFFYNEYGQEFGDGEEIGTNYSLQVDIWSKNDFTELTEQVKNKLEESGFYRISANEFYEDDVKVYHKVLRFTYLEGVKNK